MSEIPYKKFTGVIEYGTKKNHTAELEAISEEYQESEAEIDRTIKGIQKELKRLGFHRELWLTQVGTLIDQEFNRTDRGRPSYDEIQLGWCYYKTRRYEAEGLDWMFLIWEGRVTRSDDGNAAPIERELGGSNRGITKLLDSRKEYKTRALSLMPQMIQVIRDNAKEIISAVSIGKQALQSLEVEE